MSTVDSGNILLSDVLSTPKTSASSVWCVHIVDIQ